MRPKVPGGQIAGLKWHEKRVGELAFTANSPQGPATIYNVDTSAGAAQRWTTADTAGVDPAAFATPEIVRWKSFDGRTIAADHPAAAALHRQRPVLVTIHGGPEGQAPGDFNAASTISSTSSASRSRAQRARLDRLRQDVRRARQRHEARGLGEGHRRAARLDRDAAATSTPTACWFRAAATAATWCSPVATQYADRIAGAIDVVGIANFVTSSRTPRATGATCAASSTATSAIRRCASSSTRISPVTNAGQNQGAAVRRARQERSARARTPRPSRSSRRRARTACRSGTCAPTTRATASRARRTRTI